MSGPKLVLASASPRRLALLAQIGITPDRVHPTQIDETPLRANCRVRTRNAWRAPRLDAVDAPGCFVLAADTVVAAGRRILPKAETETQARACLTLLSGRRHRVMTAVVLRDPGRPPRPAAGRKRRRPGAPDPGPASRLSRQRRVAGQGRRLCHPGPRRIVRPLPVGQLLQRGRPAAVRDGATAARPRLAHRRDPGRDLARDPGRALSVTLSVTHIRDGHQVALAMTCIPCRTSRDAPP